MPTLILRNKAGQTKEIDIKDAPKYGIAPDEALKQYKAYKALQTETGQANQQPVANTQDILSRTQDLSTGGERTGAQDAVAFGQTVKLALDKLNEAQKGGLPGASGPLTNILSSLATTAGKDTPEAALKDQLKNIVQLLRKQRTGVAFAPAEQKEIEEMFGSIKTQEEPLRRKLEALLAQSANEINSKTSIPRDQVEKAFGYQGAPVIEKKPISLKGILPAAGGMLGGVGGAIVGGPVGAGAGAFAGYGGVGAAQNALLNLLGKQNQTPLEQVSDVSKNAAIDGLLTGATAGAGKLIGKGAKAVKNAIAPGGKNIIKDILQTGTRKELEGVAMKKSAVETASKAGKKFDVAKVVTNVEKELGGKDLQSISEAERGTVKKLYTSFRNSFGGAENFTGKVDPKTALNRFNASVDAFTKEGGIKAKAAGRFEAAVHRVLKEEFKDIAPDVLKGQSKIKNAKLLQQVLNRRNVAKTAGGAVVAGAGFYGLRAILDALKGGSGGYGR